MMCVHARGQHVRTWGLEMTAITAHLARTGEMRVITQVTVAKKTDNLVRVRTPRPWNKERFFDWLLTEMSRANPSIPHLGRLAELAGLHPSTLSNWKTGKQRPTLDKLSAIADVLGKPRRDVWLIAGLVETEDVESAGRAETAEEQWGEMLIRSSNLSEAAKERLLAVHREDMRRQRAEAERQLREKIELLADQ